MNEQAFLLCDIVEQRGQDLKVKTLIHDDTECEIVVHPHEVEMLDDGRRCWLRVEYSGERGGIATITLPKPIIEMGRRITVNTNRIRRVTPRSNPKGKVRLLRGIKGIDAEIHQAGEVLDFERVEGSRGWLIVKGDKFFIVPFADGELVK